MGRIKKLKETDLVGGAQSTDVYPITSTLAVYDEQNKVLEDYLTHLRNTATFVGIAIPETNPGTPTSKVFYIAKEKGTYRYFGKVITEDEVIILLWDSATWRKLSTGIASQEKLTELRQELGLEVVFLNEAINVVPSTEVGVILSDLGKQDCNFLISGSSPQAFQIYATNKATGSLISLASYETPVSLPLTFTNPRPELDLKDVSLRIFSKATAGIINIKIYKERKGESISEQLEKVENNVGDTLDLKTSSKSSLVSAINEVVDKGSVDSNNIKSLVESGYIKVLTSSLNVNASASRIINYDFKANHAYRIHCDTSAFTTNQIVVRMYKSINGAGDYLVLIGNSTPNSELVIEVTPTEDYKSLFFYFGGQTTSASMPIEIYAAAYRNSNENLKRVSYQFGLCADGQYNVPTQNALVMGEDKLSYFYGLFDALASAYPSYITKIDCDAEVNVAGIPTPSYMNGYPIYMYKFKPSYTPNQAAMDATTTSKTPLRVLILGGTHPEYMGIWDLYNTMRIICESWTENENIQALRWEAEWYIMPCSSPYSVKNGTRTNYNGVDLNRNMPTSDWYKSPVGQTYGGESPCSEYESKVLDFYTKNIKPNVFIDHHNTDSNYPRILMYITSKTNTGVDIGAAHIQTMSLRWKKRFTSIFGMDNYMYGFAQHTEESGARSTYGFEQGALSFTYESQQSLRWADGVVDDTDRLFTSDVATLATDGFLNFLLRVLKTYSSVM